jgi:hypothetical protein
VTQASLDDFYARQQRLVEPVAAPAAPFPVPLGSFRGAGLRAKAPYFAPAVARPAGAVVC